MVDLRPQSGVSLIAEGLGMERELSRVVAALPAPGWCASPCGCSDLRNQRRRGYTGFGGVGAYPFADDQSRNRLHGITP
jgi:hypothetical protein